MSSSTKGWIVSILSAIVGALIVVNLSLVWKFVLPKRISGPPKYQGLKVGTVMPNFVLSDLEGKKVSFQGYRGKKVLVVFSSPECGACNQFYGALAQFIKVSKGRPEVIVLSASSDAKKNRELSEVYRVMVLVLQSNFKEFREKYKVFWIPFVYLVDEGGRVIDRGMGEQEGEKVLEKLRIGSQSKGKG